MIMLDTMKGKVLAGAALASTALVSTSAFAQDSIDVTVATEALGQVSTAVALIGVAMISAIAGGIAYRWIVAFMAK